MLHTPVSMLQFWVFAGFSLLFFLFVFRAALGRSKETGARRDSRSRLGIVLQSVGIGVVGIGDARPTLPALSASSLLSTAAIVVLMGGSISLFASSSRALGKNWSLIARTRSDHELVRSGPYAIVRHPIYLGMLFFLLALAVALGHWLQLIVAIPTFLAGTLVRTRIEDRLLEQSFGETFRDYQKSTPALIPRIF